jgi:hypothetical protein
LKFWRSGIPAVLAGQILRCGGRFGPLVVTLTRHE